jgi:peptidyl-prolyl cis-trans isomerase C
LVAIALITAACSNRDPRRAQASALPPGALARVGNELVMGATVQRISAAQGVDRRAALELAISDALFAQAARAELPVASVRGLERASSGRALLEQLRAETSQSGPPTSAELQKVVQERWVDLDRPDAVRTTHAVVMNRDPARDGAAREVADKLLAALAQVPSESELIRIASALPADGFEIRAEALPFVTADGRVLERRDAGFVAAPSAFDLDFARAANAIREPGQLSGVVKSAFGYHVIRLEERALGVTVPEAELPTLLGDEVLSRRAKRARRELVERLRSAKALSVDRAADELTAQIKVTP